MNSLKTFVVLAETLHFGKTAQILNTVQPAISRQISQLENELGYSLFIRTRRAVQLSTEGKILYEKMAHQLKDIEDALAGKENLKPTHIRIGAIPEAGANYLFDRLLEALQKNRIKNTIFHLELMSSKDIFSKILTGEIDYGFVSMASTIKSVKTKLLVNDPAVIITAKKNPVTTPSDITGKIKLITYREYDYYTDQALTKIFSKKQLKNTIVELSINSHQAMINAIEKMQEYYAVIPKSSFDKWAKAKQVKIIWEGKSSGLYWGHYDSDSKSKQSDNILKAFWN